MCDCDCEPPKLYEEREQRARKEHKCCECRQIIKIGEKYHSAGGIWVDRFSRYKWCANCDALRRTWFEQTDDCVCFGELHSWCEQAELSCRVSRKAFFENVLMAT